MSNPIHIVSVIAVILCEEKFLLVQRSKSDPIYPGLWQNLGGKVEEKEQIEEALAREICEEVGLQISTQPLYSQSYSWEMIKGQPNRIGLIFSYDLPGTIASYPICLDKELDDYGWFTMEDIEKLPVIGKGSAGTLGQLYKVLKDREK